MGGAWTASCSGLPYRLKNPVLTEEKNNALYNSIAEKFQDTIFKNRIGTAGDIIIKGQAAFQKLGIEEQCAVLHQIFYSLKTGDKFDTSLIGGSKQSGVMAINKKVFQTAWEHMLNKSAKNDKEIRFTWKLNLNGEPVENYFRSFSSSSKFSFFAESTSSVCRNARLQAVKNASISNSILITNAIPAEGIPNCVNKMV